jgi:catechol 2,3-dioxygenase-like lactoylglutathione lyase family enzyme
MVASVYPAGGKMTFQIRKIFHLIHMSDNFEQLNTWYDDVFQPRYFADHMTHVFPTWDVEKRDARLFVLGDCVIEAMSPSMHLEGWDQLPVGRFYNRIGRHWHSIAWYVDDTVDLYETLKRHNVRFFFNGGGSDRDRVPQPKDPLFPHPKDTCGALELSQSHGPRSIDPRYLPGWDPTWWARNHPLGLIGLSHISLAVSDLEKAKSIYVGALGGTDLGEIHSDLAQTFGTLVSVGDDTLVELAVPAERDSLAGRDLERNGDIMHATTWRVVDLDQAADYLKTKGIQVLDRDQSTLIADPESTFGAVFRFTTLDLKSDRTKP